MEEVREINLFPFDFQKREGNDIGSFIGDLYVFTLTYFY